MPQMIKNVIASIINLVYEFHHELPNDLRLKTLISNLEVDIAYCPVSFQDIKLKKYASPEYSFQDFSSGACHGNLQRNLKKATIFHQNINSILLDESVQRLRNRNFSENSFLHQSCFVGFEFIWWLMYVI